MPHHWHSTVNDRLGAPWGHYGIQIAVQFGSIHAEPAARPTPLSDILYFPMALISPTIVLFLLLLLN